MTEGKDQHPSVQGPVLGSPVAKRSVGSPALFAISYLSVGAAIYVSLGVMADHALGLTPFVILVAGVLFLLTTMTYVEGSSLHQERGGASVFARYAFNELWSFVAGWAILLDYTILVAICAVSATNYVGDAFYGPIGRGNVEIAVAIGIVGAIGVMNVAGLSGARLKRIAVIASVDLLLQIVVIVLGLVIVFSPDLLLDSIDLGTTPPWNEAVYALTIAAVAFTGLETASSLAGEVAVGRRGLRRLVTAQTASVLVIYVAAAAVALTALPVIGNDTSIARNHIEAPLLGVVSVYDPAWLADVLTYTVAVIATVVLVAAGNSAMLGLSRLGYGLATNRQIPSTLGRLHPVRATPFVLIGLASLLAIALTVPMDLDFLLGIYAFGAMLTFTIAHASVIALRFREPDRDRPYKMPFSVRIGERGDLPVPAVLGLLLSFAGWVSVLVTHGTAPIVGTAWMVFGVALYVIYRKSAGKPVFKRVTVPEAALRAAEQPEIEYGSILVPVLGTPFDDDILSTAGRLASDETADEADPNAAKIEAIYVLEVPLSLPLDARLPDARIKEARRALARARAVGEEYEGVFVETAIVRARRAGQAIVEQARRRGVEAIVMAAEGPSRVRGGTRLGGTGGALDASLGDVTKYVVEKAPCRVILTAAPAPAPEDAPE